MMAATLDDIKAAMVIDPKTGRYTQIRANDAAAWAKLGVDPKDTADQTTEIHEFANTTAQPDPLKGYVVITTEKRADGMYQRCEYVGPVDKRESWREQDWRRVEPD